MRKTLVIVVTAAAVLVASLVIAAPAQAHPGYHSPYPMHRIWYDAFTKRDRRDYCQVVDLFGVRGTRQLFVPLARQEYRSPDSHRGAQLSHMEKRLITTWKKLPRWTVETGRC